MKAYEYTAPSGVKVISCRAPLVLDRTDTVAVLFLGKSLHMWGKKIVKNTIRDTKADFRKLIRR